MVSRGRTRIQPRRTDQIPEKPRARGETGFGIRIFSARRRRHGGGRNLSSRKSCHFYGDEPSPYRSLDLSAQLATIFGGALGIPLARWGTQTLINAPKCGRGRRGRKLGKISAGIYPCTFNSPDPLNGK